jgi:hypothetical protein
MEQNSQLACHREDSSVLGRLASSGSQMKSPLSQRRIFSLRSEYMVRVLDQKTSQVDVADLGDAELRITLTRLTASRSQASD